MQEGKSLVLLPKNANNGNIYQIPVLEGYKYFCINETNIYILQQINIPGSMLINDFLCQNTRIYAFSEFDPLFLFVPFLLTRPKSFNAVDDVINDSKIDPIKLMRLEKLKLERVCDIKTHDQVLYIRINQEKTLE